MIHFLSIYNHVIFIVVTCQLLFKSKLAASLLTSVHNFEILFNTCVESKKESHAIADKFKVFGGQNLMFLDGI